MSRARLVVEAEAVATDHDGVLSRQQLRDLGVTKSMLRAQLRARRWRTHGRRAIALHNGEPTDRGRWRIALHEVGADAALDGVTALIAAGLKGYAEPLTHVSVERGSHPRKPAGAYVHETRRRRPGDVHRAGIPRVRPATAAVRGALWARSDRQAALIVVMAVQQRITTATAVQDALAAVRRHKRRPFLAVIVADLVDGAQALSELDFAQLCRQRGLPKPSRQVVRRSARGRVYLDVYWDELGVVVEIEGIHHGEGETQVDDALRQNALTLDSDAVLRIPLLGLRIAPDPFMRQVEAAVRAPRRPAA